MASSGEQLSLRRRKEMKMFTNCQDKKVWEFLTARGEEEIIRHQLQKLTGQKRKMLARNLKIPPKAVTEVPKNQILIILIIICLISISHSKQLKNLGTKDDEETQKNHERTHMQTAAGSCYAQRFYLPSTKCRQKLMVLLANLEVGLC